MNYLFDERAGSGSLVALFARVLDALVPGGMFALDVGTRGADGSSWKMGRDWLVVYRSAEADGILTRNVTTFREVDGVYRRTQEVHRQLLYPVSVIESSLREAGFRVRVRRGYGEVRLPSSSRALIATRPG